jgi:hypothetical protein
LRRHLLDVGAGGKGALGTGEHDGAHLVVRIEGFERRDQFVQQLRIERVERLGPVQRDNARRAASIFTTMF